MCKYKRNSQFYKTLKLIDINSDQFTYYEVRKWLTEVLGYSWRKSNVRPPRSLRPGLDEDRIIFKDFISKQEIAKFLIVYVDEWSLNPSTIPLYSWMKRGEPASIVIRSTTERYNSIAAQWEDNVYFMIKNETSNEESIIIFIKLLIEQLKKTVSKKQLELRTVLL